MSAETGAAHSAAQIVLAASGTSPGEARRFVGSKLHEWGVPQCEDSAKLLVSELVTNALLHARTDMVVSISCSGDCVLLEVTDESSQQPSQRRFSVHAGTGRGLHLVEALAKEWGVRADDSGKTVWVIISTTGDVAEPAYELADAGADGAGPV